MPKERAAQNPATSHLKSLKNREIKRSRAQVQTQRNERLARRNPDRLQKQVDELKGLKESQGGQLRPKEAQTLESLERELRNVRKAREARQDIVEQQNQERGSSHRGGRGGGARGGSHLGKRKRDGRGGGGFEDVESEDTDPGARDIPMPKDSPPPLPLRRGREQARGRGPRGSANDTPLGKERLVRSEQPAKAPQTTYSAAPQIRDLRKEATDRFMPAAVRARKVEQQMQKTDQKLLEPEEVGAIEKKERDEKVRLEEQERAFERELNEGMQNDIAGAADMAAQEAKHAVVADDKTQMSENSPALGRSEKTLRNVEMEEVEDEG